MRIVAKKDPYARATSNPRFSHARLMHINETVEVHKDGFVAPIDTTMTLRSNLRLGEIEYCIDAGIPISLRCRGQDIVTGKPLHITRHKGWAELVTDSETFRLFYKPDTSRRNQVLAGGAIALLLVALIFVGVRHAPEDPTAHTSCTSTTTTSVPSLKRSLSDII